MLLIGCTAGAFTACSDGDDDQKPSCPITEYTVPSTAEIGGFYTVTGKGFEASALASVRYTGTSQEHNVREASNQANAYRAMGTTTIRDNNPLLYKDPDDIYAVPVSILPAGGIYTRTDNRLLSYDFRFSATYNTTINNTHIVNAYLGMETNQSDRQKTWFRGWGLQYDSGEIPFGTLSYLSA